MACLDLDSPQLFWKHQLCDYTFNQQSEDNISYEYITVHDASTSSLSDNVDNIPKPPPLPSASSFVKAIHSKRPSDYSCIPYETKHAWDKLFKEGYLADVHVLTDDRGLILVHANVLGIASPVLRSMVEKAKAKGGFRCIAIHGVPLKAARAFFRYLYSSCYDADDMKRFAFHLLVMSHSFVVPSLKRECINQLEQALLTTDVVVDVLQLSRKCDTPRLFITCMRLIIKEFKTVSVSEGWKVMKLADPDLEQEILESLVEADSKKQERQKKKEENQVYKQLYEAMEALLHICRDGCRTIGPSDKILKVSQESNCGYPACKVIESLVRHFSGCKDRAQHGCQHCKRMWQLLELHSRMCYEPESCKVPLCRHFKGKMKCQTKKEEVKWNLLVRKVMAARGTFSSILAWKSPVT